MSTEWVTPKPFIYLAKQVLGEIDLDPASSDFAQRNVQARRYFTPEQDGLAQPWSGRVWLSPPNGRKGYPAFTGKLIDEYVAGNVEEAIVLVPNATDAAWFHRLAGLRHLACHKTGRIRFESPDRKSSTPANGQVFFYLGERQGRFAEVFRPLGPLLVENASADKFKAVTAADRAALAESRLRAA